MEQRVLKEGSKIIMIKFCCVRSRVVGGQDDMNKLIPTPLVGIYNHERGDDVIRKVQIGNGIERLSIHDTKPNGTSTSKSSPSKTSKPLS